MRGGRKGAGRWGLALAAIVVSQSFAGALSREARAAGGAQRCFVGLGVLAHNLGRYSTDVSGSTPLVSSVYGELSAQARFPLGDESGPWGISPFLGITPIGHGSPDGGVSTRVVRLAGRGTYGLGVVDLQAGLGLLNSIMSASGGTVSLNNGNTVTRFGLPSGITFSNYFYWEAGAGVQLARWRWDASFLLSGVLSSRRAVSFSTQISFGVL